MRKYLLDHDPETKKADYIHIDPNGGAVIESVQDVEDVIEFNNRITGHHDKKADKWFVGQIPLNICQQWATESGTKVFEKPWQEYAKKQMNRRKYKKFNPNNIKL